jgi:Tetraspanin family
LLFAGAGEQFMTRVSVFVSSCDTEVLLKSFDFTDIFLSIYSSILLGIVVLQISLVFIVLYYQIIQQSSLRGWDQLWAEREVSKLNKQIIDHVQQTIQCCGSSSLSDYGDSIPKSCCAQGTSACIAANSYKNGCKAQIKSVVENSEWWIAYATLATAIIQVTVESFLLLNALKI